ncbi:MAG: serine protease [Burkholderiales bacterium]|nr:serine protease [Burkholderiales bacterium]
MALRSRASRVAGVILAACVFGAAQAASPQQAGADALSRAMDAMVALEVTAADDARSTATLGREREGSGVVIGADGLILTIGYLVVEADTIQVTTSDHRVVPARPVGYDLATGFGLVRTVLPLEGIQPVTLGTARDVPVRTQLLVAVGGGAGMGLAQLVDVRPFSGSWEYHIDGALFTSPPLANHSGAALFDRRGQLLGIGSLFVSHALGDDRRVPGNMFVPVDLLKPILAEMLQTGSSHLSRRPWLGLNSTEQDGRVEVLKVMRDSPAEAAGLAAGDVVLAIDGEKVSTLEGFYRKLWSRGEPDSEIRLTVLHGADIRDVTVRAVDRMRTLRKPAGI